MEARTGGSKPPTSAVSAATPVPPPSTRRPRVREVSSRFMSPVSSSFSYSSSSAGDLHFLTSNSPKHHHNHQQHHQIQRSVSAQRHRRQLKLTAEGDENRSTETAARSLDSPFTLSQVGKPSKLSQSKPLRENSHRLDTPTPIVPPPARSRLNQPRLHNPSVATRLFQLDHLPTLSCKNQPNKIFNNSVPSSPLNRSLSSPSSSCNGRESTSFSRIGLSTLPPVAPNSKITAETKKQKKATEHLEDVHSLKLLHNRYLQWRFANANAEIKTQAQRSRTESMIYSFGSKISELNESVQRKRIELERLSRVNTLLAITESQTPCLEHWSAIEEEYSTSLSQTIEALTNASLRLPLDADMKVESKQLGEAIVTASKVMDGITQNMGNYTSKAKEMESLVSELARVTSRERSLTEDCGNLLLKSQASHIEECSLRSQLIQHQKKIHQRRVNQ